jgi:hypothetical protein
MKKTLICALACAFLFSGCAKDSQKVAPKQQEYTTLIDGAKGIENWRILGDANWHADAKEGAIIADKSKSKGGHFLISPKSYENFELKVEFYAEAKTNSGVFIRCSDATKVNQDTCFEINIWDTRPGAEYATASIVELAAVPVPIKFKAGGKWNTFEIKAQGDDIKVYFNGELSAHGKSKKFKSGPIALQYAVPSGGVIKWRKVEIKPL